MKIKEHEHVNHLRCVLDETMSDKTMALRVIKKKAEVSFIVRLVAGCPSSKTSL